MTVDLRLNLSLYNAISDWNDKADLLTEEQVSDYADSLYQHMVDAMFEEGLLDTDAIY